MVDLSTDALKHFGIKQGASILLRCSYCDISEKHRIKKLIEAPYVVVRDRGDNFILCYKCLRLLIQENSSFEIVRIIKEKKNER